MTTAPRVRILSTGSEILQGLYPDTNAQLLSRILSARGFRVAGHVAAPDSPLLIEKALETALRDCDLLVMTGGLGPTEDDVNRDILASLWDRPLELDERAEAMMRERFAARGIEMPQGNVVQAMLPGGCVPLYNHWGTAPGFVLPPDKGHPVLVALPGPAGEWRPMLEAAFEEVLLDSFPNLPVRAVHTLHVAMTPESIVNEELADLFSGREGVELTLLARRGHIRVRIVAEGVDAAEADGRVAELRAEVVRRLGAELVFVEGPEDMTGAQALVEMLASRGETLALAESCTGGAIARAVTDVPGSSAVFLAGWVTYSNAAKSRDLGVAEELIAAHGAVSGEVARAMAERAREIAGAEWALSVTGIAGPSGGTEEKPVGTVWIGMAGEAGSEAHQFLFSGDRAAVREWSVNQAVELLRRCVRGVERTALLRPGRIDAAG